MMSLSLLMMGADADIFDYFADEPIFSLPLRAIISPPHFAVSPLPLFITSRYAIAIDITPRHARHAFHYLRYDFYAAYFSRFDARHDAMHAPLDIFAPRVFRSALSYAIDDAFRRHARCHMPLLLDVFMPRVATYAAESASDYAMMLS